MPLEDVDKRIDGWKSVLLDPNEEGPSKLTRRLDEYALRFTSTANIIHDEDRDGIYSVDRYSVLNYLDSNVGILFYEGLSCLTLINFAFSEMNSLCTLGLLQ